MIATFEDDLKCPICTDLFTEPKSLRCGHSYCSSCIALLESPVCPQCRVSFDCSQEGGGELKTNAVLKSVVERVKARRVGEESVESQMVTTAFELHSSGSGSPNSGSQQRGSPGAARAASHLALVACSSENCSKSASRLAHFGTTYFRICHDCEEEPYCYMCIQLPAHRGHVHRGYGEHVRAVAAELADAQAFVRRVFLSAGGRGLDAVCARETAAGTKLALTRSQFQTAVKAAERGFDVAKAEQERRASQAFSATAYVKGELVSLERASQRMLTAAAEHRDDPSIAYAEVLALRSRSRALLDRAEQELRLAEQLTPGGDESVRRVDTASGRVDNASVRQVDLDSGLGAGTGTGDNAHATSGGTGLGGESLRVFIDLSLGSGGRVEHAEIDIKTDTGSSAQDHTDTVSPSLDLPFTGLLRNLCPWPQPELDENNLPQERQDADVLVNSTQLSGDGEVEGWTLRNLSTARLSEFDERGLANSALLDQDRDFATGANNGTNTESVEQRDSHSLPHEGDGIFRQPSSTGVGWAAIGKGGTGRGDVNHNGLVGRSSTDALAQPLEQDETVPYSMAGAIGAGNKNSSKSTSYADLRREDLCRNLASTQIANNTGKGSPEKRPVCAVKQIAGPKTAKSVRESSTECRALPGGVRCSAGGGIGRGVPRHLREAAHDSAY